MFIAKNVSVAQNNDQFELFKTITMKGVDGEDVEVLQSIGYYSLAQLEDEKQNYLNAIAEIEDKISSIESL